MKVRKTAIIWIAALLVSLSGCAEKKGEETTAEVTATEVQVTEAVTTQAVTETQPPTTAASDTTEAVTSKAHYLFLVAVNQGGYSNTYAVLLGFLANDINEWIRQEATVHLKIVNDNGEVVFEEDRKIKEKSYEDYPLDSGKTALLVGHLIPFSKITKGSASTGKLIASAALPDGRTLEETTEISDLPSNVAATAEPTAEAVEDTYEHNEYYDVVETGSYTRLYNILVHKVLAKQDVSISSTVIAYASNGDVIGKSTDSIILTKGEYNYFMYSFNSDISGAELQIKYKAEEDPWRLGDRSAVEMVKYNKSGNELYITVKQAKEKIGSFAKYKILFYKDDKIVKTDFGYFVGIALGLDGVGTTDVISVSANRIDFDRIEYIYEP